MSHENSAATVWVTGAGGLIGHQLVELAACFAPGMKIIGLTRAQLDLTDHAAVTRAFREQRPSLVIHCAAMSKSPACQADPARAKLVNVEVTRHLAELAEEIPFIFFSTDLVFDGRQGNYVETDAPNPLSIYAETKVAAEQIVLRNPRHTIVRTSLNFGRSPKGDSAFNEDLLIQLRTGKKVSLFTDEFRSPIPAAITARAVWELAAQKATGVFHLAGVERLSRWDIGQLVIARTPEFATQLVAASRSTYSGAPRPPDTSLNCAKIQHILSFPLPKFSAWMPANVSLTAQS